MKTIIFNRILEAVETATEIDRALICSRCKRSEVVEARSLLFHYLYAAEFSRRQIADLTGLTRQCVSAKIQAFPDKDSRSIVHLCRQETQRPRQGAFHPRIL